MLFLTVCEKVFVASDRDAMKKNLYEKLNDCAKLLEDEKHIIKLSAGDLVAKEAKYHLNCLTTVYKSMISSDNRDIE